MELHATLLHESKKVNEFSIKAFLLYKDTAIKRNLLNEILKIGPSFEWARTVKPEQLQNIDPKNIEYCKALFEFVINNGLPPYNSIDFLDFIKSDIDEITKYDELIIIDGDNVFFKKYKAVNPKIFTLVVSNIAVNAKKLINFRYSNNARCVLVGSIYAQATDFAIFNIVSNVIHKNKYIKIGIVSGDDNLVCSIYDIFKNNIVILKISWLREDYSVVENTFYRKKQYNDEPLLKYKKIMTFNHKKNFILKYNLSEDDITEWIRDIYYSKHEMIDSAVLEYDPEKVDIETSVKSYGEMSDKEISELWRERNKDVVLAKFAKDNLINATSLSRYLAGKKGNKNIRHLLITHLESLQ